MTKVLIYEVGPRDGLQNEKEIVPTEEKIALINHLSEAGFQKIEAASFVSPKWVPQLADGDEVMSQLERVPGVTYAALTPNLQGLQRAIEANTDEVAVFAAASETFSQKNINCSIEESFQRFEPVIVEATRHGIPVRGYVSCVVGCPYEGVVEPAAVRAVAMKLLDLGCYEISLGDTIGVGTPQSIADLLSDLVADIPISRLAGHFHDTNNRALVNVITSLTYGLRTFDSAIGGLGGCPYAPGARGNVSTRALAELLLHEGWDTGLNLNKIAAAEQYLNDHIAMQPLHT